MRNKITSTANPQVKQLLALQKKAKERNEKGVFVVEGPKMYAEAPRELVEATYVSETFYERNEGLFANDPKVTILQDRIFETVSDTKTPQGVLCLVKQLHYNRKKLLQKTPLVLALECVQDPGNLGTIVRTAEAAGATGLLLSSDCVDIYNPKVIRSTMGAIYRVPFFYAADFLGEVRELQRAGVRFYAAHLQGSEVYDAKDYTKPSGFLIGNESRGLTTATATLADGRIRIPMCGQVESLNAAVATAVLVYEASRQRRKLV